MSQFGPDVVKAVIGTAGFLTVLLLVWPPIAVVVAVSALAGLFGQLALARRRAEAAPGWPGSGTGAWSTGCCSPTGTR